MGKSQRTKGASGEREAAALLNELLGLQVARRLGQARDGGDDLIGCAPFRVEVKRRARIGQIYDWLAQVQVGASATELPVVMARADGKEWIVAMPIEVFAELAKDRV